MKKLLCLVTTLLSSSLSYAGLISHTDYTAGNVITAAGQNTNENAIVNEFNGNINSANIATGGVTSTNILDGTILNADLNSTLQSTMSYVAASVTYRRPQLRWISTTLVDVENNDPTLNRTCILFPSGQKCVTEDTASTNKYRRFDIAATANFTSGTEDSGLRNGETRTNNTWYAIYAVASQINTANFVLVGSTIAPAQVNVASLNTFFGVNGWVYLGTIAHGDGRFYQTAIASFRQSGSITCFNNVIYSSNTVSTSSMTGVMFENNASIVTEPVTVTNGSSVRSQVPLNIYLGTFSVGKFGTSGTTQITNLAQSIQYAYGPNTSNVVEHTGFVYLLDGITATNTGGASAAWDFSLTCFVDSVLGNGTNPLF